MGGNTNPNQAKSKAINQEKTYAEAKRKREEEEAKRK